MTAAVFHLNTVQCVNIDSLTDDIIFETRYVKMNTSYYFTLSQEQFHAFDDILCVNGGSEARFSRKKLTKLTGYIFRIAKSRGFRI